MSREGEPQAHSPDMAPFLNIYILFCRTKLTFKDLGMDDLGIYSCDVTDTDGIASSYVIDEEGKFKISAVTSLMLL